MIEAKKIFVIVPAALGLLMVMSYVSSQITDNQMLDENIESSFQNRESDPDKCSDFSKYECSKHDECYPTYVQNGPARDKVGMPVVNFQFSSCVAYSESEMIEREKKIIECDNQNGHWTTTYGNPKGFCVLSQ